MVAEPTRTTQNILFIIACVSNWLRCYSKIVVPFIVSCCAFLIDFECAACC